MAHTPGWSDDTPITRETAFGGFDVAAEHDEFYSGKKIDEVTAEVDAEIASHKIVIQGSSETGSLEDASYLNIYDTFTGELSVGQRQLFELLVSLQRGSLYALTTVAILGKAVGVKHPGAIAARLENLKSLGAISGLKI